MSSHRAHEWIRRNRGLTLVAGVLLAALAFVPLNERHLHGTEPPTDTAKQQEDPAPDRVVVTYFHTTVRCPSCKGLEAYSRETVESGFAKEIEQGRVVFRHVNVQEPENEHFIKDYRLYTKSLIVSLIKDGKQVRWKNLPDIWKLVRNRERFEQYVKGEIEFFLKDL